METISLWKHTAPIPPREALQGDLEVENVVIGAGMAGLLTAYFLQLSGRPVVVLEADRIACGQTGNTTAKITSQHGLFYHNLLKKTGRARAKGYALANEAAIKAYEEIIHRESMECSFEKLPAFLYTTVKEGKEKLKKEAFAAEGIGINAEFLEGERLDKLVQRELPFPVKGAVCFQNQAQFHPLEFIKKLSEPLTIYEHTKVFSVKGHVISTAGGTVTADNIIFAVHYPFLVLPGFYFLRQHQERSYVLALKEKEKPLSGMYYGIDKGGLSFRSAKGQLLLGGGGHRTGVTKQFCAKGQLDWQQEEQGSGKRLCKDLPREGYEYLIAMAARYYPDAEVTACWAAQDCMPHDRIPLIGRFSVFRPYWYVATGFQKWGMTSAMISAQIISDSICGREHPYQWVFSPKRLLFHAGITNICVDFMESVTGLTKGWFGKKKRRCRHMGCQLAWNSQEESWDCPCHGSRYDKDGKLLDHPAQKELDL